jgi:hypothetical protein
MTEQNQTPADVDDAEGHIYPQSAEDYRRTEDATRGRARARGDVEDTDVTEGHQSLLNRGLG